MYVSSLYKPFRKTRASQLVGSEFKSACWRKLFDINASGIKHHTLSGPRAFKLSSEFCCSQLILIAFLVLNSCFGESYADS